MGLDDKVILITGAAGGIGQAIAHLAAAEGATALFLTDRDEAGCRQTAADLRAGGCAADCCFADLADVVAPPTIAAAAIARFGRIDGLVNAAALTTRGSFLTGTAALWDQLFAVDARAPFLLMQAVIIDAISRCAPASIVNILSMNAYCGIPELAIYSATKGALATLTRNAARAHMADRIRVNGVNLGWVATPAEMHMQADILGRGPGWLAEDSAKLPLGRLIAAEESARLAVFLLGDASVPMSGSVVDFEQKVAGGI